MTFKALMLDVNEGKTESNIKELTLNDLPDGEVTIKVAYSSINFKDGLATIPNRIVKTYPFIPGIDLAGIVAESRDSRFKEGDEVIVTSYGLGVSHFGGFSEMARVPADWVVKLPKGLSLKEAMILGTAGFTAGLSVVQLEKNGLSRDKGHVLVTGATGGVGSVAVDILAGLGYEVAASTGKESEHEYLRKLGASEILTRSDVISEENAPLLKQRWAGAVDPVGGKTLEYLLKTVKYGGSVALSGLTGGTDFAGTVYPFILRGINLLGIDSVFCPMEIREPLWNRLGSDLKPKKLMDEIVTEVSLEEVPSYLGEILQGQVRGRTVVKF